MTEDQRKQMKIGAVLIVIGAVLLANQLDWRGVWRLWPVVPLVWGAPRLLAATVEERSGGIWLVSVGGIFLMHTLSVASLRLTWPLFLVPLGLTLLLPASPAQPSKAD